MNTEMFFYPGNNSTGKQCVFHVRLILPCGTTKNHILLHCNQMLTNSRKIQESTGNDFGGAFGKGHVQELRTVGSSKYQNLSLNKLFRVFKRRIAVLQARCSLPVTFTSRH